MNFRSFFDETSDVSSTAHLEDANLAAMRAVFADDGAPAPDEPSLVPVVVHPFHEARLPDAPLPRLVEQVGGRPASSLPVLVTFALAALGAAVFLVLTSAPGHAPHVVPQTAARPATGAPPREPATVAARASAREPATVAASASAREPAVAEGEPHAPCGRDGRVAPTTSAPAGAGALAASGSTPREDKRLARTAFEEGRFAEAKAHATRARDARPDDADAWLLLGAAEQALGSPAAARATFVACTRVAEYGQVAECHALLR